MILYKSGFATGKRERAKKEIKVNIDELPKRPLPKYNTPRDQEKFIKLLKASEAEQNAMMPRSKHPCTRKKKKQIKVKHGNRKKK